MFIMYDPKWMFSKISNQLVSDEEAILVEAEGIWESEDHRWTFINDFENFLTYTNI